MKVVSSWAVGRSGKLVAALAELPFGESLRRARAVQEKNLNDAESGGRWLILNNVASLEALIGSGSDAVSFVVQFEIPQHREALKAAGHSGVVLLMEDARHGTPTANEIAFEAIEVSNFDSDVLAVALALYPPAQA
jgi:hypothetical protein